MNKLHLLFGALALLGGCQTFSLNHPKHSAPVQDIAQETPPAPIEYASFSEQTLYELLAAELAGQRNRFDIALGNYLTQAEQTGDSAVSERAFRIAEYLGAEQAQLDSALLWASNSSENIDAQRAAAIQLARAGRYDESMQFMEQVLQRQGDTHFDFLALSAAESDPQTRAGLLQSFDRLQKKFPENSQLLFGRALLLQQDDRSEQALKLLESNPKSLREPAPLLLRAGLLQNLGRSNEAMPLLRKGISAAPQDKRLRLAYARLLVEADQLEDAQEQFAEILKQNPLDDDLRLSLALVCLQAGAWDDGINYLNQLIDRERHLDIAYYNLGRAYDELNDSEAAIAAYSQVGPGTEYLPAQQRLLAALTKAGRLTEAREYTQQARLQQPDYAVQLYLIEAEALNNGGHIEPAWQLIETALAQYPDDLSLLYTRAMLAEKRGDLEQLESDLRLILQREPDHATALNALGYTLADRTERYDEALELIERAHQLNPTDPAILDSLGWINYRLGNLNEAAALLRQALRQYPDAEVAAHLGEVLWAQGKHDEAKRVWRTALEDEPNSQVLRATIERVTGSENL